MIQKTIIYKCRFCHSAHIVKNGHNPQKRIPGPLRDRIDIHIEVPRIDYEKLSSNKVGESSEAIRVRVQFARNPQHTRFANPDFRITNNGSSTDIICNVDMRVGEVRQFCQLQTEGDVLSVSKHQSLMRAATSCCA